MQFEYPRKPPKTISVKLTYSEAQWIDSRMRIEIARANDLAAPKEVLARKIVRARRQAVAQHLPFGFFDENVELWVDSLQVGSSIPSIDFMMKEVELARVESQYGVDEEEHELHNIELELSDDEISIIYEDAKQDYVVSSEIAKSAQTVNDEVTMIKVYPEDTSEEVAHKRAELNKEANGLFEWNFDVVQVTSGIVAAIDAHRAAPPSN